MAAKGGRIDFMFYIFDWIDLYCKVDGSRHSGLWDGFSLRRMTVFALLGLIQENDGIFTVERCSVSLHWLLVSLWIVIIDYHEAGYTSISTEWGNCCLKVHSHVTPAFAFFFDLCLPVLEKANAITCCHRHFDANAKCRRYVWTRHYIFPMYIGH